MNRLIPASYLTSLKHDYRSRYSVVAAWLLSGALLVCAIGIAALVMSVMEQRQSLRAELEALRSMSATGDSGAQSAEIDRIRVAITAASAPRKEVVYAINSIVGASSGVRIEEIAVGGSLEGAAVTVSGIAGDRQALVAFADALKATGDFTDVSVPVSSFVKEREIPFSLSMGLALHNDQ